MKFNKLIFILLSIAILIACVLPVIFNENAAISINSAPALAFGVCSVAYAIIAFLNKEHGNAFLLGKGKLFITFLRSLEENPDTDNDEYNKEFALSAFIFCASIPFYIPLAFFAESFYTALSSALFVTILREVLTIALVMIPCIVKNVQNKKKASIKDEADRKEQEHSESMGKWK